MADNFAAGESDAAGALAPTPETMGARMHVSVNRPQRGEPTQQVEPYLLQPVHALNGNMETVVPAIQFTPLGAEVPGPQQVAPAIVDQSHWKQVDAADGSEFSAGVSDGYPEGSPVPYQVGKGAAR